MNPKPMVNTRFNQMNGLQRSVESFRYVFLCTEQWISPGGKIREWLRYNVRLSAYVLIPAIFVLPIIGFILWQLAFWLSMFTGIVGKLILIFALLIVLRMSKR